MIKKNPVYKFVWKSWVGNLMKRPQWERNGQRPIPAQMWFMTEEWLYDYTAAQADQEMARGRALIEARQELLEKRQQREGAGPQTPSQ